MMTREEHRRLLERLKDSQMTDEERSETDAILWEEMMKPEAVPFLAQEMRLMPEVFPTLAAHPIQTWTDVPKATLTKLQWELKVYLLHARTLGVWETTEEINPQEAWERLRSMSLRHPWSDPLTEEELDFRVEAENTRYFKENVIEDETKITCPDVIDELTTERIFTMTFVVFRVPSLWRVSTMFRPRVRLRCCRPSTLK